ncbi:DUF4038 domain-containing protein [Rugosimonospora acidiphila]|uniref:DUF4038 domain-containing protein n=1 Tax=Rugosimonospora acidiphila TaxID=556531 RepID=A0ABP9RV54_9ACTN
MPRVTIDSSAPRFLVDGEPQFLLSDTIWCAFARPTLGEWRAYLRLRRRQGFNALNINILSIPHDRSASTVAGVERSPFLPAADGSWDLDRPDPAYFANARAMLELAIEHGMVPTLVVLWCNYVPGTWGAALTPELVLTEEQTDRYVDLVIESFADLGVTFAASGDDNFTDPRSADRYERVLRRLREKAPDTLLTLHPGVYVTQPPQLTGGDLMDYYSYQAGHDEGWDTQPGEQATGLRAMPVRRPIVSMEPCYEGHGYGKGSGRHTAADVRLASWSSVLAGAGAGLGYGAHGVWSWHRPGEPFNGEHFSGTPFPADVALRFDGAWDVGLLRRLVEAHGLHDLASRQDLVVGDRSGARFGLQESPRRAALYLPHPFAVTIDADLSGWQVECWNLGARNRDRPNLTVEDGRTRIEQPEFLSDSLFLFTG